RARRDRSRQDAGGLPVAPRPALRPQDHQRAADLHPTRAGRGRLRAGPEGLLPRMIGEDFTREEVLRFLDRETAVARGTAGRMTVLVLELRRVDRLQALLKGPAAATTMALVLERIRKVLRNDDRVAAINDDEVCIVLPRLAHPTQAVLAAVKVLRTL